jgi:hydroxyacylglutathione hydrolase
VVQCQSGGRSSIAASVLEQLGVGDVTNLSGGITAWAAANLPIEKESREAQTTGA